MYDKMTCTEFKINDLITLKLEYNRTNIYINNERFRQCKYLLINIPSDKTYEFDEIDSIDKAEEFLDHSLERINIGSHQIDPKTEFWAHCSNLQAWYENDYDTRLLHRNIAFPLLNKLRLLGDTIANKRLRDEIARRFVEGSHNVKKFLLFESYTSCLSKRELEQIFTEKGWLTNFPPESPEDWKMRAYAYKDLYRYEKSIWCLTKLLEITPNDIGAKYLLGGFRLCEGSDLEGSIDMLKGLINTKLREPVLCMIGNLYSKLGNDKKALKYVNDSLKVNDQNDLAWRTKGDLLAKQEKNPEALRCFDKAIEHGFNNPSDWNKRGKALNRLNRYYEALKSFHKAFELNPDNLQSIDNLACSYARLEVKDQTLKYLSLAKNLDQDIRRWVRGKIYDFLRDDRDFIRLIN